MSKHIDDADPKAERINREILKGTDRLIAEMRRAVKRELKRFSSAARHHFYLVALEAIPPILMDAFANTVAASNAVEAVLDAVRRRFAKLTSSLRLRVAHQQASTCIELETKGCLVIHAALNGPA